MASHQRRCPHRGALRNPGRWSHQIERRKPEVPSPSLLRKLYLQISLRHDHVAVDVAALSLREAPRRAGARRGAALRRDDGAHARRRAYVQRLGLLLDAPAAHHRALYARFHKQHHEFKGTVGAAAEYAHPFEVVSNQIPTLGFVLGVGAHPLICLACCPPPLANVRGAQRLRVWRHARRPLGADQQRPTASTTTTTRSTPATARAEHMDWLFGTMDSYASLGGRKGYLKSRRADARATRRSLPGEGRLRVLARTACDITLHATCATEHTRASDRHATRSARTRGSCSFELAAAFVHSAPSRGCAPRWCASRRFSSIGVAPTSTTSRERHKISSTASPAQIRRSGSSR